MLSDGEGDAIVWKADEALTVTTNPYQDDDFFCRYARNH